MRPSWFKISAILAGLWLVVGAILWWLESQRPSVEKVLDYVAAHPVAEKSDAERKQAIEAVAAEFGRLSFDEQRELLASPGMEKWWKALALEQRREFRMAIFPQSRKLMEFFSQLPPEQQKHHFERMKAQVEKTLGVPSSVTSLLLPQGGGLSGLRRFLPLPAPTLDVKALLENPMLDMRFEVLLYMHELLKRFVWSRR